MPCARIFTPFTMGSRNVEFVIIGAGQIGSAVARELVSQDGVTAVRVLDSHARALSELGDAVHDPKLQSFQVDARDVHAVAPILAGASCVIGAGSPALSLTTARLALEAGSHYCDLGGPDSVLGEELALEDEARARGRWIVPGCGLAPGLVNMVCVHGVEQFDRVESACIRVGDIPHDPVPPFRFQVAWSAEKLVEDYTQPVHSIVDGELHTGDPLEMEERIRFAPPFESLEAFTTAGSLSMLARDLVGRVRYLDHKTIRWPGHLDQMRFVMGLGLGEPRSIDVRTHLTYRDILIRRMRQRIPPIAADAVLMRITVHGEREGRMQSLVFEMTEGPDPAGGISAMRRCTAVPAATVALLLAGGAVAGGGAAPPERVVPREAFLHHVATRGLEVRSTWRNGYVPVTDPVE